MVDHDILKMSNRIVAHVSINVSNICTYLHEYITWMQL